MTYFVELDDVWVSDFLQDSYFTVDALEVGMVLDLVLLQDFDGNLSSHEQTSVSRVNDLRNADQKQRRCVK